MLKSKTFSLRFFLITFLIFVVVPVIVLSYKMVFKTGGDSIAYILQSESLYYDHDFLYDKRDILRFDQKYHKYLSIKNLPVVAKKNNKGLITFAKPIFFTLYFAAFTPIINPVVRATTANLLLVFLLYFFAYKIIKDRRIWLLFCAIMFLSQLNFYIPQIHPEIFFNFLVFASVLPVFFSSKKPWLYIAAAGAGGLLMFEKQLAVFFPLMSVVYLFIKRTKKSYLYLFFFVIVCLLGLGVNLTFHGDFITYEGLRGLTRFDGRSILFSASGDLQPFVFPLSYGQRFLEYFFGKNIGIFVYDSSFAVFITLFFYYFRCLIHKKANLEKVLLFLPVFFYVAVYFVAVDPVYSYGGSTSLGNRYFFQIYFYLTTVSFFFFSALKGTVKKILIIFSVLLIFFSGLIYIPFYKVYQSAIQNHLIVVFQNKVFRFFPMELSYVQIILSDLESENKISNKNDNKDRGSIIKKANKSKSRNNKIFFFG